MTRGEERPAGIVFIFNKTEGDGRPAAARAGGGRAPRRPARGRRERPHDAAKRLSSVSASHHGPSGCAVPRPKSQKLGSERGNSLELTWHEFL